jgi:hypothetical protein
MFSNFKLFIYYEALLLELVDKAYSGKDKMTGYVEYIFRLSNYLEE